MISRIALLVIVCVASLAAVSATAADWVVGAGAGLTPDYQGSEDYTPTPVISVRGQNLYHPDTYVQLTGPRLKSNLLPHANFRIGPSAEYILKRGFFDIDNDAVDAMAASDDGFMLGILLGYDIKIDDVTAVGLEFEPRYDITGNIGGLYTLRGLYRTRSGKWGVNLSVEGTYASDDYMSEFFDVTAANAARSGLTQFNADGGVKDLGLQMALVYRLSRAWSVTGIASFTRLLEDASDSPITDDEGSENQFFGGVTVNHHF